MPFPPSKKKPKRREMGDAALSLTSLMDMFTIILLFLLVTFTSEGEVITANPKFKLPLSTSQKKPEQRLIVQITSDEIMVDGSKVADTKEFLDNEDYTIKPLLDVLNNNIKKVEYVAERSSDFVFKGDVTIQGDQKIPFILLEKVMFTCGEAGYGNISLAVMSRE